jgi:hypothetical protein
MCSPAARPLSEEAECRAGSHTSRALAPPRPLPPLSPQEIAEAFDAAGLSEEPEEDAREERVFRMWLNSLALGDGSVFIRSLTDDLSGGDVLIDAILAVGGESVGLGARKVNRGEKLNQFKRVREAGTYRGARGPRRKRLERPPNRG